jgi:HemY protein
VSLLYIHNVSDPLERYRKVEKLTAHHPHHEESYWLMAKAALEADLWGQARHHIQPAGILAVLNGVKCRMCRQHR